MSEHSRPPAKGPRLIGGVLALFALSLAGATHFDLDRHLIGYDDARSASGINALGLPYLPKTNLVKAHDLMAEINAAEGSIVVVSISRFLRNTDTLVVYNGTSVDTDFDLLPSEGYRVKLSGEETIYPIRGTHNADFEVRLYGAGDTVPEGTTEDPKSETGTNDYAPPYNRVAETASDLMEELNGIGCPGGTCSGDMCSGGTRSGEDCTPFMSVSRFIIVSDTLETYTGGPEDMGNNFNLVAGESYRVQVSAGGVRFVPEVHGIDVDVEIENRPPSPCSATYDGGLVRLRNNTPDYVRLEWHGGDPDYENPRDTVYTNLVFSPDGGPTACGTTNEDPVGPVSGCVNTCPGPRLSQPSGCEKINCDTCGCEIASSVQGYCIDPSVMFTSFIPCLIDSDCDPWEGVSFPVLNCARRGELAPQTCEVLQCNQTACASGGDPDGQCAGTCCESSFDYPIHINCCDQPGAYCADPALIQCVVIDPRYQFSVVARSNDGSTWIDLVGRGMVPHVTETNCCEFVCGGAQGSGNSCTSDGDCVAPETCKSPCNLDGGDC